MISASPIDLRSPRSWLALAFLIAAYFGSGLVEAIVFSPIARAMDLHMIADGMIGLAPFAALTLFRLVLNFAICACIVRMLGRNLIDFPLIGKGMTSRTLFGIATGSIVMIAAIATIILTGNAVAHIASQPILAAVGHGSGWFISSFIGAAGEELFGRVAILLVAERFVGWRGAIIVSGVTFAALHLGNPGASRIWLLRLVLQGMLLAYAVYRTRSFWWSTGYHTGWNWASAPLFGAAGSGYLNQGHLLDFTPTGSVWVTGGAIGPEGSIFAFLAVLCAFGILAASTPNPAPRGADRR